MPWTAPLFVSTRPGAPVRFELTEQTREAADDYLKSVPTEAGGYLFPNRVHDGAHLSTRQYARPLRDWLGDVARDLRGLAGRIKLERVFPDQPQTLAHRLVAQVFQIDTEVLPVGKLRVVLTLPGEVGVDLDAVPDIANEDEGRPAVAWR